LNSVKELHRKNYQQILKESSTRSLIRLKSLEFNNLYCYGEGNYINFTKLENKLGGAIAPNKAGKSSLIDIIIFALYDKYPRAESK
jgi:DNA repair exonuclease SbcCD ATPase subunit